MSETEEFITEKDLPKSKPKRQPTEAQLLHLENIRKKAMEKKKEMRETTEKANKQKEIESGKLQKKLEKEQLAKKYEETIEKAKLEKIEVSLDHKPEPKPQPQPKPEPERPSALVLQEPKPEPRTLQQPLEPIVNSNIISHNVYATLMNRNNVYTRFYQSEPVYRSANINS